MRWRWGVFPCRIFGLSWKLFLGFARANPAKKPHSLLAYVRFNKKSEEADPRFEYQTRCQKTQSPKLSVLNSGFEKLERWTVSGLKYDRETELITSYLLWWSCQDSDELWPGEFSIGDHFSNFQGSVYQQNSVVNHNFVGDWDRMTNKACQ